MITFRQINIENCPYYIFNDLINIKNFDLNLVSIDKISFKSTDAVIYNINITMKSLDHKNPDSKNFHCFIFNNVAGYIIEESNEYKYFIFASPKETKKY